MREAIRICRQGVQSGNSPFGCLIVMPDGRSFGAHNRVWQDSDITAHAEITCLRKTCTELRQIDLSGAWLFSTTEPCPMCAAACHWARIEQIVYGASIADAAAAGFCELDVSCTDLLRGSSLRVRGGVLAEECAGLFAEWKQAGRCQPY